MNRVYSIKIKNKIKSIKRLVIMMDNLIHLFKNKIIKIINNEHFYEFNIKNYNLFKIPKNINFISDINIIILETDYLTYKEELIEELNTIFNILKEYFPYNILIFEFNNSADIIKDFKFDYKYLFNAYISDITLNTEKKVFIDQEKIENINVYLDLFIKEKSEYGISKVISYLENSYPINFDINEQKIISLINRIRSLNFLNANTYSICDEIILKAKQIKNNKYNINNIKNNNIFIDIETDLDIKIDNNINFKTNNYEYFDFIIKESLDFNNIILIIYNFNKIITNNLKLLDVTDSFENYLTIISNNYFKDSYKIDNNNIYIKSIFFQYNFLKLIKYTLDHNNNKVLYYIGLAIIDEIIIKIIINNLNYIFDDNIIIFKLINDFFGLLFKSDYKLELKKIIKNIKKSIEINLKGDSIELYELDFYLNIPEDSIKKIYFNIINYLSIL